MRKADKISSTCVNLTNEIRNPATWTATFGFYTPTLRTPELVPGQVRLLRSLMARIGEGRLATILLADTTDGTYTVHEQ